jgi:hypothetical protein
MCAHCYVDSVFVEAFESLVAGRSSRCEMQQQMIRQQESSNVMLDGEKKFPSIAFLMQVKFVPPASGLVST